MSVVMAISGFLSYSIVDNTALIPVIRDGLCDFPLLKDNLANLLKANRVYSEYLSALSSNCCTIFQNLLNAACFG